MFLGKYQVVVREGASSQLAVRDLSSRGRLFRRRLGRSEEIPLDHLASLAASVPRRSGGPKSTRSLRSGSARNVARSSQDKAVWLVQPPEYERLEFERTTPGPARPGGAGTMSNSNDAPSKSLSPRSPDRFDLSFAPLSSSNPARWNESDSGVTVSVDVERAGNPLSDGEAAAAEMARALTAWTDVPEGRLDLQTGNDDAQFTASNPSPAQNYPPGNIILFDDPYNDISDPNGCSGVLAIGGYWRTSSPVKTVNGQTFYPILRLYVIFNNDFECFLGNADNLAEVATHELGHGIGLGHSTVLDAIMRSSAYGSRGPRLGDDDRDAMHCHYPHTLTLIAPDGGESWEEGSVHSILWSSTIEAGPDPGTVDIELSTDGGNLWSPLASDEPNDGAYAWTVSDDPGNQTRIRVIRDNLVSPTPPPYPGSCSGDGSDGDFTITASAPMAGTVPDGSPGTPLRVDKGAGLEIVVTWGASCSTEAAEYALYEGTIAGLRSGGWDHSPVTCSAGTDLTETITPGADGRYYLVAPLAGSAEGTLGSSSSGSPRPESGSACAVREASSCQ
jgi:hypothetical protein